METINHECYVSLEVAKLLKEAGFDWKCICYYTLANPKVHTPNNGVIAFMKKYEELFRNHNETKKLPIYSAPTLDVAQRWLREVKSIIVLVDYNEDKDCEENERFGVTVYKRNNRSVGYATYVTYEEALEAGIKAVLELILEKGE